MSIELYSNGARIVGIESVIGCDLENPARYWFECMDKPIYVLTELCEFMENQENAYSDAAALIDDMPGFDGDTYLMSAENMKRYIEKHFYVVPFSKGEHGLAWYSVGSSRGWDCGTAGFFLLPRDEWDAASANRFSVDAKHLMECMSAWANGDEYATHEYYISGGSIEHETCYGFYGRDDAISDACVNGYEYLGEFNPEDDDEIINALIARFPENFKIIEHVEHVPEKTIVIPAHDETWTEFTHVA